MGGDHEDSDLFVGEGRSERAVALSTNSTAIADANQANSDTTAQNMPPDTPSDDNAPEPAGSTSNPASAIKETVQRLTKSSLDFLISSFSTLGHPNTRAIIPAIAYDNEVL